MVATYQAAPEAAGPGLVEAEHRGLEVCVPRPGLAQHLPALVPHPHTDHVTIRGEADLPLDDSVTNGGFSLVKTTNRAFSLVDTHQD